MTFVVAELGINHGGDLALAKKMIVAARECGCDAVKIQTYRTKDFLPPGHSDWDMFERAEIWEHLNCLRNFCSGLEIGFGATPTSVDGVRELARARVDFLKNGSDFLLRHDLLVEMSHTMLPTYVATGMALHWNEIRDAAVFFAPGKLVILHCTSAYPCPDDEVNLARLSGIGRFFRVGLSDHTQGTEAAVAATVLGAEVIEKHFTLDKNAEGPDHWFSADPAEMTDLVRRVRRVEQMIGSSAVHQTPSELVHAASWRVAEGEFRG